MVTPGFLKWRCVGGGSFTGTPFPKSVTLIHGAVVLRFVALRATFRDGFGEWLAQNQGPNRVAGFHLSELHSPFRSLGELGTEALSLFGYAVLLHPSGLGFNESLVFRWQGRQKRFQCLADDLVRGLACDRTESLQTVFDGLLHYYGQSWESTDGDGAPIR